MKTIKNNIKNLFGRVKLDLIPNVSEFNTFILGYSEFAAIFGLKSPNRKNTLMQFKELNKANKYITKNMYRLMKYAAANEMAKHDYLANILLTRSDACLVASIHHKAGKPTKGSTRVWYLNEWCKVISLINKTRKIARDLSCKLELKRVWIDKKEGDYARGLGVPKLHWRVHTFQENRMIENTLIAKKMLTPWQHGGRSFKGTHTAWEQIMFVLRDKAFIYEFDIKGFYDNIITKEIVPFLGEKMASRIQAIVDTTKPTEFKLPPEEKDIALKSYREAIHDRSFSVVPAIEHSRMMTFLRGAVQMERNPKMDLINAAMADKARNNKADPHPMITGEVSNYRKESYAKAFEAGRKIDRSEMIAAAMADKARNNAKALEESIYENRVLTLKDSYKSLMEGEVLDMRSKVSDLVMKDHKAPTLDDREQGREKWKNLSQEGRGFPQGLSFSPILSTNALERALPEARSKVITMYMDDGLIYGDSKSEVLQMITKLEAALSKLGISLAPEKSGWVRENFTFVKESKFLGIKTLEDGTMISSTRNGTSRPFPNPLGEEEYLEFCKTLEINASTSRMVYNNVLIPKGKEHVIWLGRCMGNILNYMYAPESSRDDQEWKIMEGRMKYCERILKNKHKTLQRLEKYFPEPITRPGLGERLESIRTTSVSSIAAIRLLRYLKEKRNRRVRA
jgi:hypothetical protein